jgi:hypothetical protein
MRLGRVSILECTIDKQHKNVVMQRSNEPNLSGAAHFEPNELRGCDFSKLPMAQRQIPWINFAKGR